MIILNINDLFKFMLESVVHYVSVLVLILMSFFLLTSAISIVSEKIGSMICTIITVYRASIKLKNESDDKD